VGDQYGLFALPVIGVTGMVGTTTAPGEGMAIGGASEFTFLGGMVTGGAPGAGMAEGAAGAAEQLSQAGAQQSPLCLRLPIFERILSSRFGRGEPHWSQAGAQVGAGAGAQHVGAGAQRFAL